MNPRKAEFILTLIAGITGAIAGLFGILGGTMLAALSSPEISSGAGFTARDTEALAAAGSMTVVVAVLALIVGVVLFIFAFMIKKNTKVFGILILVLGAVGFFLLGLLWIVPGVLAIIAGIMCLARKVPTEF
ncbi:DUF4064 domain-containing protein [Listeria ilorinensis]|uniref:DUF4064 domain-containing protein n=1 Tax=Listeria ilorinensis TaxID=2867439 RepID=UPI001EF45135|nr:DUF4064 domain-containing protein [Listeria ilorinensis]